MVYLKLEENQDKFMARSQMPKAMKHILFQAKCRKGKFEIQKLEEKQCIQFPQVNAKLLKNLKILCNRRCWKTICVSENLRQNEAFLNFATENHLQILDGKWLFKRMFDDVIAYIAEMKNEFLGNQEISILCNQLDETIVEKIKEICPEVKVCNVLTHQMKQFQKLEDQIYQANGIVLNVSNNGKKALLKSSMVLNFDFGQEALQKCVFAKNTTLVNLENAIPVEKAKENNVCQIVSFGLDMPEKYREIQNHLTGFKSNILYESFLYKRTSYRNIKKEILADGAKILYLQDAGNKILKKSSLILPKTLDKISI